MKKIEEKFNEVIRLRSIEPEDMPFLKILYAAIRIDLQQMPLATAQKEMLIDQQFQNQHFQYQTNYSGAALNLVLIKEVPIGRLYLHQRAEEIRIMDIALLPTYQNQGIGTFLLQQVLQEGRDSSKAVSLHIEKSNPALKLYKRTGFKVKGEVAFRYFMEWNAIV